ncbi:anthrone oxygenase family protein [Streptomyces sp. NPDC092369]|uniref:anthrone oxygenase family protein n=1 Tax=Streptomyces sp. NPDC092369 TaxID=3366015 RepID=UPI0038012301
MLNSPLATATRWASRFFSGIFAGFLIAVLVFEWSLRSFDRHVYTQVRQVELDSLDKLAVVTLIPAMIATALLIAVTLKATGSVPWLLPTALALLIAILALTLAVNLPINADQLGWSVQGPPANWAAVRDHWQIAHAVRSGAAVLAYAALSADATTVRRAVPGAASADRELPAVPTK